MKQKSVIAILTLFAALVLGTGVAIAAPGGVPNGKGHGSCLGQDMKSEATTHEPGYMGDVISSDTQDTVSRFVGRWDPDGPRSVSIHRFLNERCDTSQ